MVQTFAEESLESYKYVVGVGTVVFDLHMGQVSREDQLGFHDGKNKA